MEHNDEVKAIQQELLQLQGQVTETYYKIKALEKRLHQLHPELAQHSNANASGQPSRWKWENFIGLRLIHLAGIIVLVIGLSIGVKYAIDKELISVGARIGLAYAAGIILFILSIRLKAKYDLFSAILFSGAMASLYFTTYAAFVYYQLVPAPVAFILMVLFTIYTAMQAISYNRQEIALLGLAGAYGIPFLISQNSDNATLFFLYIFIIDLGILYLYYKQAWKGVGRVAVLLTWMLFLAWSSVRFDPLQINTAIIFLAFFFLLFSIMIVCRRLLQNELLVKEDVYMQVINNVALYIGAMFVCSHFGNQLLATITGCFSLFLGVQAWFYNKRFLQEEPMFRLHLIMAFVLAVLYVMLEWDGVTVTFIWMLMAILLFVWGAWQKLVILRLSAMGLMGLTLVKLVLWDSHAFTTIQKVISYISLGILLLVTSFFYQKFKQTLFSEKDPTNT